jgi:hypothetical protein
MQRLAADPPAGLDPWAVDHLEQLTELAGAARSAVAGDSLVHLDVRADNVLLPGRHRRAGRLALGRSRRRLG